MTERYQYSTKAPGHEWSEWQDIDHSIYEGYLRDWGGTISPNGYAQVRAMTTPSSRVSDERLAEIERWAASEEAECREDDMPVSASYYTDVQKMAQSLRPLSSDSVSEASKGVRVKPLEWDKHGEAKGAFAKYTVYEGSAGTWNAVCYPYDGSHYRIAEGVTEDDAKGAVNAHHSAAILSALDIGTARVPLIDSMADEEFERDRRDENPNVGNPRALYSGTGGQAPVGVDEQTVERTAKRLALCAWDRLNAADSPWAKAKYPNGPGQYLAEQWRLYEGDARAAIQAIGVVSASPEPKAGVVSDEFSITLTPTRTGFRNADGAEGWLRLWVGKTNRGQPMGLLSTMMFCEGKFEGMDYSPVDISALDVLPNTTAERIEAVNALFNGAKP